jgi:hypothetical protein
VPAFIRNNRRRPQIKDVLKNPLKFVSDLSAAVPTGASQVIEQKVKDVVIPWWGCLQVESSSPIA